MAINLVYFFILNLLMNHRAYCGRINLSAIQHFMGAGRAVDEYIGIHRENHCPTVEKNALTNILGSAFNPRYMSIDQPLDGDEEDEDSYSIKRMSSGYRSFAVDDEFSREISEVPAWEMDHSSVQDYFVNSRRKRDRRGHTTKESTPWECKSKIVWIDLGVDYFPRYLRSIECEKHECWYGMYFCKPRSFTVKILRRKKGKCAYVGRKTSSFDVPKELREMWVWEERAVNFCCECGQ